jgi:regulator of sigma E protease
LTSFLSAVAAGPALLAETFSLPPGATYVLSFLVALGILIFVHEFGHFWVARRLGIGVTKFSFGFGPKLFGFTRGETEYLVSAIPFGGYVKMVGEGDADEVSDADRARSFHHKPVWVRMAVVAAGPAGNLIFAVFAFWIFLMLGVPVLSSRISVEPGGPAEKAGLLSGDRIVAVDGVPVSDYDGFDAAIAKGGAGRAASITVERGGARSTFPVTPAVEEFRNVFGEKVRRPGVGTSPFAPPRIGEVGPGSPAGKAGLRRDDLVVSIDNEAVSDWDGVATRIKADREGRPLRFVVKRDGAELPLVIVPRMDEVDGPDGKPRKEPRIGIGASPDTVVRSSGPLAAIPLAFARVWEMIALTAVGIWKLLARTVSTKELGGPLLIAKMAGDQARLGLGQFVNFLGFLSVNLGVLNLLPVPVLDGGHLLFFSIEGVLRRPLSERTRVYAQQVGLFLLLMLMVTVIYNDLARFSVFDAIGKALVNTFHGK